MNSDTATASDATPTLSDELDWERASGRGTVRSWTRVTLPVSPAFVADLPFVMALVHVRRLWATLVTMWAGTTTASRSATSE